MLQRVLGPSEAFSGAALLQLGPLGKRTDTMAMAPGYIQWGGTGPFIVYNGDILTPPSPSGVDGGTALLRRCVGRGFSDHRMQGLRGNQGHH